MQSLLEGLNNEQRRAVETTEGPLLILAGAGSGKTKTLTHRIANIIAQKLATPDQIMAVTFTNKAAKEMRERVAHLLGADASNRSFMPFMGTFHSFCVRFLRIEGQNIGLSDRFVIFDDGDQLNVVKKIYKDLGISEKEFAPRSVLSLISSAKNELIDPEDYLKFAAAPLQKVVAEVYPLYQKELGSAVALDFDDLIGRTVLALTGHKDLRTKWQNKLKYVMIDEYQDTNAAQYKLVRLLTNDRNNLAVVGDDWQSIYSWRGADFRNILNFEKDYPDAAVIRLEQNYRSTKSILDAAHKVILKNEVRSDKKLWTDGPAGAEVQIEQVMSESHEGDLIARVVNQGVRMGVRKYSDFAILYRTNAQSRSIEESMLRYGLPYKIVGGVRFYDRKEIKDIMAYLRFIFQPSDLASFLRIINVPGRGLGDKSVEVFLAWAGTQDLAPAKDELSLFSLATPLHSSRLLNALSRVDDCPGITPKAKTAFKDFAATVNLFNEMVETSMPSVLIESLIKRIGYLESLEDGTTSGLERQENVREL